MPVLYSDRRQLYLDQTGFFPIAQKYIHMKAKLVSASRAVLSMVAMPRDANPYGQVYGGTVMSLVDQAAYAAAVRHARNTVVTACVDRSPPARLHRAVRSEHSDVSRISLLTMPICMDGGG